MPEEDIKPQQLEIGDLPIQPVDSQSPVPLYHQINLDLRRMIIPAFIVVVLVGAIGTVTMLLVNN